MEGEMKKWDPESVRRGLWMICAFLGKESSPIVAQRVRRTLQILQLHSKLWAQHIASLGIGSTRHPNSRGWLLGFAILSLCKAKDGKYTIDESELQEHMKDLDFIHELTSATVVCPVCNDRLIVDKVIPKVQYCHCPGSGSTAGRKIDGYSWVPFLETPDLLVWRQPQPDKPGYFIYKVYGYYDDISANDFLSTQLDLEYRKEWDNNVLQLDIIESDHKQNLDIIYWEMKWPRMFSNRDYSFARRHMTDENTGTMVIISKAIVHHKVPERSGTVRVKEYWSVMQIKAVKGLDKPGVEFGLTYFDNPGVSLPGWLTNWATMAGIPDFLNKVRIAARARHNRKDRTKIFTHHPNPVATPESDTNQPEDSQVATLPYQKSEILSQFFKENFLLKSASLEET